MRNFYAMLDVVGLMCTQSDNNNLGPEMYMPLAMANSVLELWEWHINSQQGLMRLSVGRSGRIGCHSIWSLWILQAAQTKTHERRQYATYEAVIWRRGGTLWRTGSVIEVLMISLKYYQRIGRITVLLLRYSIHFSLFLGICDYVLLLPIQGFVTSRID